MKTAAQTLEKHTQIVSEFQHQAVLEAMKQYAEDAIRESAERATVKPDDTGLNFPVGEVDKESILSLIKELK